MIDLFIKGGVLMYPLALFSVFSLAIILERGIVIFRSRSSVAKNNLTIDELRNNDMETVSRRYRDARGAVACIGLVVLENRGLPGTELEERVSQEGSRIIKNMMKNLHILELVGKISPMVGLSGTVIGLARSFQRVATARSTVDPSMLAGGIWEALITTVTGLFVAIPAIIFYHLYVNLIRSISSDMHDYAQSLVRFVKGNE